MPLCKFVKAYLLEHVYTLIFLPSHIPAFLVRCSLSLLGGLVSMCGIAQSRDLHADNLDIAFFEAKAAAIQQEALRNASGFSNASNFVDIHYLNCAWSIDPGTRFIQGAVRIGFTMNARSNVLTLDLADELRVDSIRMRSTKLPMPYRPFDKTVIVNLGTFLDAGTKEEIEIFYKGVPPGSGNNSSFVTSTHSGVPVMWTLSQPYGSRDWWPCKNGLNDKIDSLDIAITTPEQYTSTANGLLVEEKVGGGLRTTRWKHRYPIAPYLIAIAATNYSVIKDQVQLGSTSLPILEYAYPETAASFKNAAAITKRTMQMLYNSFGEYPFIKERYGHTQFGFGGGMEHQTNSFMFNMNETLIVHEAAHQWFGNKVTCGTWKDIWLNEGFAFFCTNLNIEKHYPTTTLINSYRQQVNFITSKPNGILYVDDTTSVARIFDSRLSYTKGGWVLQMLRWKMGDALFFKAVNNYLNDNKLAYSYARTADLQFHLEKTSGLDLKDFFADWVYGQGYPSFQLQWATAGSTWVQTILSQTSSDPSVAFFELPVPIRFKNNGSDTTIVIDHQKNGQLNFFNIGFAPDSAFIDPTYKLISANNKTIQTEIFPDGGNVVVFPNPVGNEFSVLLKNMKEGELTLSLFNSMGALAYRKRVGNFRGNDLIVIPSHQLSSGTYWLQVSRDNDPPIVKKIMK